MDCAKAMKIIDHKIDNVATLDDLRRLHTHLAACPGCARYHENLARAARLLDDDSRHVAQIANDRELDSLVGRAVSTVHSRSFTGVSIIRRLVGILAGRRMPRLLRRACAALVLVGLSMVSYALVTAATNVPETAFLTQQPGHIESFTAETDSEGRVYAEVTERNSTYVDAERCPK